MIFTYVKFLLIGLTTVQLGVIVDYINCIRDKRKAEQTAYQFRGLKDII